MSHTRQPSFLCHLKKKKNNKTNVLSSWPVAYVFQFLLLERCFVEQVERPVCSWLSASVSRSLSEWLGVFSCSTQLTVCDGCFHSTKLKLSNIPLAPAKSTWNFFRPVWICACNCSLFHCLIPKTSYFLIKTIDKVIEDYWLYFSFIRKVIQMKKCLWRRLEVIVILFPLLTWYIKGAWLIPTNSLWQIHCFYSYDLFEHCDPDTWNIV